MTSAEQMSARSLPPGPREMPILGNIPDIRRSTSILHWLVKQWQQHGDIFSVKLGPARATYVAKPEYVKRIALDNKENYIKGKVMDGMRLMLGNGLVIVDGATWKKQRKIMQPLFTPRGIKRFSDDMLDITNAMVEDWERRNLIGNVMDIGHEMTTLALSIITSTMFGIDAGDRAEETNEAFTVALDYVASRNDMPLPIPDWWPSQKNIRFKQAMGTINRIINDILKNVDTESEDAPLIGKLMSATDPDTGETMSAEQLRDEVVTIYFAGHETTAKTLTWAWFMLSKNPQVQAKLHEELDRVLGDRPPTLEDVRALTYTRMVVDETLRLFGPTWCIAREVVNDDMIDGYHIPSGSLIMPFTYAAHRHPDHWENPEGFNPDRFSPEKVRARNKHAYFPFGIGERVCIGNHFSLLETVLILATMAQKYRISLVPGSFVNITADALLRPDAPVLCKMERR